MAKNLEAKIQHERSDLQLFEKNFHKRHSELLAAVRKAEKETKKSGKKSPYQLQQVNIFLSIFLPNPKKENNKYSHFCFTGHPRINR